MKSTQRAIGRYSSFVLVCLAVWFIQSQVLAFSIGDRVQPNTTVNVRQTPAGTVLGTQISGSQGFIIGGPSIATLGGISYTWFNVNFDSGTDGWVADTGLTLTTPVITSLTTIPSPPTTAGAFNFTINGNNFFAAGALILVTGPGCGPCTIANSALTTKTTTTLAGSYTLSTAGTYSFVVQNGFNPQTGGPGLKSAGVSVTVTTPSFPNLTPYLPSGWSDKIVVSRTTGTTTDSTSLTTADTLYVNFAVLNDSTAATGSGFYNTLYVDGVVKTAPFYGSSLAAGYYMYSLDYSIGSLSAGTHTIKIKADSGLQITESNENDNEYTKTITVSNPAQPNLTPYQNSGWSDKIVVTRTASSTTDSTSLTTADTLYVNAAVINNGVAATAVNFNNELYVDGVPTCNWVTIAPLNVNYISFLTTGYSIGQLSAGTHTIKVTADYGGVIAESNEADNSYTKTITVSNPAQPNLTPYQNSGWSDKIVVTRTASSTTDSTSLTTADTLYVNAAVINNGVAATAVNFNNELYVDGVPTCNWVTIAPLNVNYISFLTTGYSIGQLSAGTHTIKITADYGGVIAESSELDNSYTKTISVASVNQPNLTTFQPQNWSDKIVVSRSPGNNTDSISLTTADSLFVDWAVLNAGNASVISTFYTYLYVDDVFRYSWYTSPPLNPNYYTAAFDYPIGSLNAGTHTIKVTTDATAVVGESSETDNSYTKTIIVGGTALPDFQITSITLNPASPQPGQAFTAAVTVKNQGTGTGDGRWLDVWANQPSVQTCGTDGNTWAAVGTLTSLQSKTFTLNLTAPTSAGSYTIRAFVDSYCQTAESNEGNNQTTLAYTVGSVSQPLPNFVVTAVTFNPAQPVGGQPFTASVTVKNQGAVTGDGKYLDVWVNQPSFQACGSPGNQSQSVGTLSVNQTKTLTYNLTAPPSGAPWIFRAFVDSTCQTPESDEGDNQLTSSYGINPVAQPDFTITAITIKPSSLNPGEKFSAFVTVKNLGTVPGNAGWLDVWANKPATAACGESGNSYSTLGTLAANETKVITVANLTAGPAGNNILRAFVDSKCASTESDESNNQKTFAYKTSQKVLLLLHGMNADPFTWDDYVGSYFDGSAPIIQKGHPLTTESPTPDSHGVVCYRVAFGSADLTSGRTGAEGVSATASSDNYNSQEYYNRSGDYSSFDDLGLEVWMAVNYILSVYPDAQITLLGHSRGGLAARAFLQTVVSSPEKSSVVALLTTGTPHKGSPLGRIYGYLADPAHPKTTDSSKYWKVDWDVVKFLRGELLCTKPFFQGTYQAYNINVTRPTIGDLADNSTAIHDLNNTVQNLPTGIKYGGITYTGADLGLLQKNTIDYHVFWRQIANVCYQLSHGTGQAEDTLLGSGKTGNDYPGDGIVPLTSQSFNDIPNFPPGNDYRSFPHTGGILHTDEPKTDQTAHLSDALGLLINW